MASNQSAFEALVQAIVGDDAATASQLLAASPVLVNVRAEQGRYLGPIEHYLYGRDTALHIAAAGYRTDLARELVRAGGRAACRPRS